MKPIGPVGSLLLGFVAVLWLFVILFLVQRNESRPFAYLVIIAGIFTTIAFFIVSYIIFATKQGGPGPWVFFGTVTFLLTVHQFTETFLDSEALKSLTTALAMLILFVASIIKLWDTLEFTEIK